MGAEMEDHVQVGSLSIPMNSQYNKYTQKKMELKVNKNIPKTNIFLRF